MKVALLLFLFCLAEADDVRYEFNLKIQQLKSQLEAQIARLMDIYLSNLNMASRPSASETKMGELQTRLNQLQTNFDQLQTSFDQLHDDMKMRHCESPGWQKFDRGCYYISNEKKYWEESRQWCRDRQSDLIVIKSKEKQDFVASFNKKVWLGLTDREREGSFQWVDGTPLTTPTYWVPGEPDFERIDAEKGFYPNAEEDCVEYYDGSQSSSPNTGWNDHPCSLYEKYWICERALW